MPGANVPAWGISLASPWRLRGFEEVAARLHAQGLLRDMIVPHDATRWAGRARRLLGPDARAVRVLERREFATPAASVMTWDALRLGLYYRVPARLRPLLRSARQDFGDRFDFAAARRIGRTPPAAVLLLPTTRNLALRAARHVGAVPFLFLATHPWNYRELVVDAPAGHRARFEAMTRTAIRTHEEAIRNSPHVFVESPNVARAIEAEMGIPAATIGVLEQGVDPARFPYIERAAGPRPLRLVSPSQPTLFKGIATSVEAVRLAGEAVQACEILGLGAPGPEMAPTLDIIASTPNVSGPREVRPHEMLAAYHSADVCLLTTVCDSMPRAVLEAMSTGLPVITTPQSGFGHIIESGVNGFIVPPRDPMAVTSIIERLSADPELRLRIGRAARATAERFTWDAWADRFLAAIHEREPAILRP